MLLRLSLDPVFTASSMLATLGMLAGLQGLYAEPGAWMTRLGAPASVAQPAAAEGLVPRDVARAQDGMFYLDARVNGSPIRLLVDTGASVTVLTPSDAARLTVALPDAGHGQVITTASGTVMGTPIRIADLKIGKRTLKDIPVMVFDTGVGASLIGQDILRRLGPITFDGDRMSLGL